MNAHRSRPVPAALLLAGLAALPSITAAPAAAQPGELLISEYVEGSNFNCTISPFRCGSVGFGSSSQTVAIVNALFSALDP